MRIRRSPSGGHMETADTRLLIEEKLPSITSSTSSVIRTHKRFMGKHGNVVVCLLLVLLVVSFVSLQSHLNELNSLSGGPYDYSPLSQPEIRADGTTVYRIGVVTDLDHDSKDEKKKKWKSIFKTGLFMIKSNGDDYSIQIEWAKDKDVELTTEIAAGGRAMELSDLVVFNRRLLTIDDRTGLIYEIVNGTAIPWVFLDDGPGKQTKPLKGEWMTVKDGELWVGGLGKEWTTPEGVWVNDHPMWVKIIDRMGRVRHVNWAHNYRRLRTETGISAPGYMVHESVQWSEKHGQWFFLPRRASKKQYDEVADELRGTNMLISASEDFSSISLVRVGPGIYEGARGFSAFQFVPNTNDQLIVALKSEERDGRPSASYITVFDVTGRVLYKETHIDGTYKFEGIAFI